MQKLSKTRRIIHTFRVRQKISTLDIRFLSCRTLSKVLCLTTEESYPSGWDSAVSPQRFYLQYHPSPQLPISWREGLEIKCISGVKGFICNLGGLSSGLKTEHTNVKTMFFIINSWWHLQFEIHNHFQTWTNIKLISSNIIHRRYLYKCHIKPT